MPKKTTEIKYGCETAHKEELDRFAKDVVCANMAQTYQAIMELGLQVMRAGSMNDDGIMKVEHIPNTKGKKITWIKRGTS